MIGPSKLLKAMRYVSETGPPMAPATDPSLLHVRCRERINDDFDGFMDKLASLERAHSMALAKAKPETPKGKEKVQDPGIDEGTELVMQLMAEEWERVQRFEAAQGAEQKPALPGVALEGCGQEPA